MNWLIAAGCVCLILLAGCGRTFYRRQADRVSYDIIDQTDCDPRWNLGNFDVYADPRSRFFEANDPDRLPAPPDDPTAARYMQCIYGMRGYRKWYRYGILTTLENPGWINWLPTLAPVTPEGKLLLDLESAVRIARINNNRYQSNMEEVYLAALDVSFERFRFDVQFFGGNSLEQRTQGGLPPAIIGATRPAGRNPFAILDERNRLGATKRFATGAELFVQFANSFVWQFTGPDTNYATSLVDFGLLIPLMRDGGRDVVLERLTRAQRTLLAAIRSEVQYRQDFFKDVAVGGGTSVNPQRIGGFQGGAGLSGFTGTGQGGFGGVGAGQNLGGLPGGGGVGGSGAGAGAGFAGGGEGNVGGLYGLIQRRQAIRNTEASLASQLITLNLLESLFDAGLIDLVQVDEFRQNIETERATLLRSQVAYQDAVEVYLTETLGLPPMIPVDVDDTLIRPFQLIGPALTALQTNAATLASEVGDLPDAPTREELKTIVDQFLSLLEEFDRHLASVGQEASELFAQRESRAERIADPVDRKAFVRDIGQLEINLENLGERYRRDRGRVVLLAEQIPNREPAELADLTAELLRVISSQLQSLALVQARVRVEKVTLPPIHLTFEQAFLIARENRFDWMNNRSAVVNQWRLIAFNANRLESFVNIELSGDMGTFGDNPVKFRSPTGSLRGRVVFDAPLNRVSERNLYRESLIDYQQAKRSYIRYVDRVALTLRARLRQIERLEENLEIQRRALQIAIRRVDQTLDQLDTPFSPPQPGQPPAQLGPTLAQNLLRALSDLRNTQDNFMSVYLNFESARMNLMFEMGIMRIDERGMWIDESWESALAQLPQGCRKNLLLFPEELPYLGIERFDRCPLVDEEPLVQLAASVGGSVLTPALCPAEYEESDTDPIIREDEPVGRTQSIVRAAQGTWDQQFASLKRRLTREDQRLEREKAYFAVRLHEIHALRQEGRATPEIAKELKISEREVEAYTRALARSSFPAVVHLELLNPAHPLPGKSLPDGLGKPDNLEEIPLEAPLKTPARQIERIAIEPDPAMGILSR